MNFEDLVQIVEKLRSPDGCPWDREQTRESLRPYLVEEFYELIDALEERDTEGVREELGDVLFQIIFQSQLYKEENLFDINDVVDDIARKMVGRHPHVFGDKDLKTSDDVRVWWEERKRDEGKNHESAIGGVPRTLPALARASRIQKKATKVGFDWKRMEDVFEKLQEEVTEFRYALEKSDKEEIEDELGDILFVLVRIANSVKVDPEHALRRTIRKFIQRFEYMEREALKSNRRLTDMTLEEMDVLWNEAKIK